MDAAMTVFALALFMFPGTLGQQIAKVVKAYRKAMEE